LLKWLKSREPKISRFLDGPIAREYKFPLTTTCGSTNGRFMVQADVIITGGLIVTHQEIYPGAIAIKDGKIVAIGDAAQLPPGKKAIDVKGKYILPGLVDPHVHFHYSERPFGQDAHTETRAAVAGGVTTQGIHIGLEGFLQDSHNTQSGPSEKAHAGRGQRLTSLQEYRSVFEENAVCDGFYHFQTGKSLTKQQGEKLVEFGITSFHLAPHTSRLSDADVYSTFRVIKALRPPALAVIHCESNVIPQLLEEELMKAGRTDHRAYNESRPRFVETEYMSRAIYLAQATGCLLYIEHVTAGEGVELLARAKKDGVRVIGETCPQYLTHSSEDPVPLLRDNPVLSKVNPPLRDKWSNEKLWEGIKLGIIESIGTDHSPRKKAEKVGTVWQSRPGLGNLTELALPILLTEGVHKRGLPLTRVAELCCYNPARIFGIYPRKGSLAPGSDADLVVLDLEKRVKVSAANLHSRCDYNIYEGWECQGWPVMTLLRGEVVMEEGAITGSPGIGRYIGR